MYAERRKKIFQEEAFYVIIRIREGLASPQKLMLFLTGVRFLFKI